MSLLCNLLCRQEYRLDSLEGLCIDRRTTFEAEIRTQTGDLYFLWL